MNKRYYVKKGASYKDRIRCPLCGKISPILNFSMEHLFGVFRYWFKGRGDISCEMLKKDITFMVTLYEDISKRLLDLLEQFTNMKWHSQDEVDDIINRYEKRIAELTLTNGPQGVVASVTSPGMRAYKVVIE